MTQSHDDDIAAAIARGQQMRTEWLLLGHRPLDGEILASATAKLEGVLAPGTLVPTYMCPACSRQRITLVTKEARLPAACPKCSAPLTPPP